MDSPPVMVNAGKVGAKMAPRKKKTALLKKAIWIHTWVLLSWALSTRVQQKTTVAAAAAAIPENKAWSAAEISQQVEVKQEATRPTETPTTKDTADDDDVIVIATVDGTLAGLCRKTGATLWKQVGVSGISSEEDLKSREEHMRPQSNKERAKHASSRTRLLSPLLSTTTTTKSGAYKTTAVPSVDGRVYLTAGRRDSSSDAGEETEITPVKDLVSRAPFVDGRGSFYVGSRHATAAALDRDTGEILRVVSGENMAPNECGNIAERNIVWLGRVDNSVSMYDTRTGASDVQFSTSEIISVQDMLAGTGHRAEKQEWDDSLEHAPQLDSGSGPFRRPPKPSLVVATPNGNVAFRSPETGEIEWVAQESFESPVAFAVQSSSGESIGVDILPDTPVPSSSPDYISRELERQMESLTDQNRQEQPLVASLASGQLFAMPLGNRNGPNPFQSLKIPPPRTIGSSTTQSTKQLTRQGSGLQALSEKHAQDISSPYHGEQMNAFKKPCSPSNPAFPGCLLGSVYQKQGGGNRMHQQSQQHLSQPLLLEGGTNEQAVTIHYHPEVGYMANEDQVHTILRKNKASRSFFKIMASWLPPTMALIFVLSFEFGRRHKLRKAATEQKSDVNGVDGKELIASGNADPTRNEGVIQVTDEILGYGGHGTMVYKGTLEGRKVAVKRMLKTYHASADREISLLIESDGHPNVVRYFLKEVRGDFVYLALELCDLSLHDLIGSMNTPKSREQLNSCHVTPAVKSTMLQIASGVRHLHSLRIVHRDLKPANILLAQSKDSRRRSPDDSQDQSVIAKFNRGEYVAKISDMGLGKQLAGQSSFGFSTLGNTSLANMPSDGSTMVGAGPGSVGWQAPEVMAVRWHMEAQTARSESSGGLESFADASPVDVAMTSRTSRSVDIFSLGCIFYSTLIPGSHPFGEWYEREANIMRNKPRTDALKEISEDAYDLITAMIDRDPKARPTSKQLCNHPFFWTPQQRLGFLCDVSDRLECADAEQPSSEKCNLALVGKALAIERNAAQVVGMAWDKDLDPDLVSNVSRFRTYDPSSVRDCLRLIRNKHHHYDELSTEIKERIGSNPDGLQQYFESRFPGLLMHCYGIFREQMTLDDLLAVKYAITPKSTVADGKENQTPRVAELSTECAVPITPLALRGSSQELDKQDDAQCDFAAPLLDTECENEGSSSTMESSYIQVSPPSSPKIREVSESAADASTSVAQPSSIQEPTTTETSVGASTSVAQPSSIQEPQVPCNTSDIIVWEGSTAAKSLGCRGWFRSDDEWVRKTDLSLRKRNSSIVRCADDPKFRTRLCNHWDISEGTFCPMQRKSKCVFAHGPVELRVKEGKRSRWGKLVDKNGDNANPRHSGGEDTYGAARSIESVRKEEGKWNTSKAGKGKGRPQPAKKRGSKTASVTN